MNEEDEMSQGYDRELVARMLEDGAEGFGRGFSQEAMREQARLLRAADNRDAAGVDGAAFKNFHRSLCERFGYTHDERDWRRDQVSLEEHIASLIATPPVPDAVRVLAGKWRDSVAGAKRYSTTDYEDGFAAAERACATELEQALSVQEPK